MIPDHDMLMHYWDLCGGNVQSAEFNELANAAGVEQTGDFTAGNWKAVITPTSGKSLVVFSIMVASKVQAAYSITAFRLGTRFLGNVFFSSAAAFVEPVFLTISPPIRGVADETVDVWCSANTDDKEASVVITYGEVV